MASKNRPVCTGNARTPTPPPSRGRRALGLEQRRLAPIPRRQHLTPLRPSMGRPGAEAAKPGDRAPRRGRASPVSPRHHLHLLRPSMGRPGAESSKPGDQAPLLRTPWSRLDCRRPRRRSWAR
uniref:Predicted protein n=1 Tax=Hordeum vulgare subsp. vulgare TaxID=112509 RepID=F2DC16_HORVV|nr:predicted protein [Hordeum vulgare subsp. vulgare]